MQGSKFFSVTLVTLALLSTSYLALADNSAITPQLEVPHWPHTQYDSTPTVEDILGYPAASRVSSPEQIVTYFESLAAAHPDKIKLFDYGKTWEGRRLFYAVISSADNIAKLADHQQSIAALADPRVTNASTAKKLITELPGSIWIGASVHGNEISPAEATLVTAWHLLASQATENQQLLNNTLIYLDPLQNPDGRARFVSRYYSTVGIEPSSDRLSAEHNEAWPNGRTNHYLFDLNRDWFALTQPETRGKVAAFLKALPLHFIDSHEMGGDSTFFFAPSAEPLNPLVTPNQRNSLTRLGKNNGRWFDRFGYDYFTAEIFDLFYPGYGGNWPNYSGSLATTYEMASARGHHFTTQRGDVLTYADGVQRNFVAYLSSIENVANNRQALLENFYDYRRSALDKGGQRQAVQSYILPNQRDAAGHQRLAAILTEQGIEVRQTSKDFQACGKQYQAGAYVIDAAQPSHHLVRALLDADVPLDPKFLAEQERLRANNLRPQIYDVTAWSLPHLYNLDLVTCTKTVSVSADLVGSKRILSGTIQPGDATYGYIVRWGDMNAGRLLTAALREGLSLRSADSSFKHQDGREFPAGTLVFSRAANPANLTERLTKLAEQSGANIEPLANSWITSGPSIGSRAFTPVLAPKVAVLWDEPTSVLSAGSTRFIIEREFNYPTTAIRSSQLQNADLSAYQVIILPATNQAGAYEKALGEPGRENLRDWVKKGGVIITLGNATGFAVSGKKPLLQSSLISTLNEAKENTFDRVPGIIARSTVDQEHWLTAGVPEQLFTNYIGTETYAALPISKGRNVINFADADNLVASGHLWAENRQQLAGRPYLLVQPEHKGLVISFTQEPNLRAYQHGQFVLLLNAIFRGAAHASPVR
ncbi:M14 family zinc carboxypeptidase [Rheinheimera sp. MMS21-TC3]|uniref:M14 family zinc carboxypeptidase n=1 Tax=Rheinheimera sp. MMS21-TC3 TaxID=3072790 RepID=UPI0028C44007|nr:M14 family zinc carboxypeptidase [Rheinheimera sp. MMS21-TC3]WNO60216.1 M14 family zinc carboxypeptidase [Rheinheimera sp. MMS21-TC3]